MCSFMDVLAGFVILMWIILGGGMFIHFLDVITNGIAVELCRAQFVDGLCKYYNIT